MNNIEIEQNIIGLTYGETIQFFKKFVGTDKPYYFRPIQIGDSILLLDDKTDYFRCNLIFTNGVVSKIDGWY